MKKILSIAAILCLMLSFALPIRAAGFSVGLSPSKTSVSAGEMVTFTVTVTGAGKATSGYIEVALDDSFELVSGKLLVSNVKTGDFDVSTSDGAFLYSEESDPNGGLCEFVVKAKTAGKTARKVSVTVDLKNGSTLLGSISESREVKIGCASHTFGAWEKKDSATHTHTCTVCGEVQSEAHKWNGGEVTRKPTCTEPGEETGVCSRCKKEARAAIPALGHSFGEWTESKAPTCTEPGVRKHTCATCGSAVEEAVAALGHDFENPTVVKEPTISTPGLREGTCKRCGETTQESIPCRAVDAATGIRVDAEEGTFAEGTEFAAEPVSGDDARRETISAALEGKGTDYTAYELSASRNGESVSPKKPLKATFPVPAGYGKAGLLLIGADGRAKEVPVTLNADGTLTAELSELGLCVVYQKGAAGTDPAQPTDAEEPGTGFPVWIAVAIGGAVVAGGAVVLVLVLKKKKAQ